MVNVGIIHYGAGNLRSVAGAIHRLGHSFFVIDHRDALEKADKLILPGVGAFGDGMQNLRDLDLIEPLHEAVLSRNVPILGICLGFQMLGTQSEEHGLHQGLGWLEGMVRRIEPDNTALRVPHVGWNDLIQTRENVLWKDVPPQSLFYYVHSYCFECENSEEITGETEYGGRVVAAVHKNNIYGTQFHPEKSQQAGLQVLRNFIEQAE